MYSLAKSHAVFLKSDCEMFMGVSMIPNTTVLRCLKSRAKGRPSLCDGATCSAAGVKDRSITQPRVSLITFSPPWNGGIFGTYRLTGLSIRSYVPTQTSIQILGIQGDMFIKRRTRKQISPTPLRHISLFPFLKSPLYSSVHSSLFV